MVRAPDRQDDAVVQELREAGLRVTMARQAVLTWLAEHPHSTADTIAEGVREQYGALSLQAIYGVLAACADAGLLRRIEPAGHPARFERAAVLRMSTAWWGSGLVLNRPTSMVSRSMRRKWFSGAYARPAWRREAPQPERNIARRNGSDRNTGQGDDNRWRRTGRE